MRVKKVHGEQAKGKKGNTRSQSLSRKKESKRKKSLDNG